MQKKLIQKLTLIAKVKGYNIDVENDKVIIKKRDKVVFVVEITETGFAISSPISQEDWDEKDMELFEYISSLLMEYTLLKKLKEFFGNGK